MPREDVNELLDQLCAAAGQVGIRVTFEPLDAGDASAGGLCKVKGEWRLIGDRRATPQEKVDLVAMALARFDVSTLALPSGVREALDRSRARTRAPGSPRGA